MRTQVIVLNGGSSSGKSSIARELQATLPDPWLSFSVDSFVDAMPPALTESAEGVVFEPDGGVSIGATFRTLEAAWMHGIACTAEAGARVILDDVFLGGRASQERWLAALRELPTLWVGVHCAPEVAAERERRRGDRIGGMAESQAALVHRDVSYDLIVDTTSAGPPECAAAIAAHLVARSAV